MTVRLYPTPKQTGCLVEYLDVSRRVYNHALEQRIKAYKRRGESIGYYQQTANLTRWRKNDSSVQDVPFNVCREALKRLNRAFQAFFHRCKNGDAKKGFPRFKAHHRWDSFEFLQSDNYASDTKIRVPKLGLIRCRNLRPIDGKQKMLRVFRRGNRWFAQILIDDEKPIPPKKPVRSAVGLDVGLTNFTVSSDGVSIAPPRHYRRLEAKLRRTARNVSRKKKGSRNRRKAVEKLRRVHFAIADARSDFTHKLSRVYADSYDLIAVEKLNINGMIQGRLAKSILDAAWGQFINRLRYKVEETGSQLVDVNPHGTSQECSKCGNTVKKDLSQRIHDCPNCGLLLCRDENAAINILNRGLETLSIGGRPRIYACGERPLGYSLKQEVLD